METIGRLFALIFLNDYMILAAVGYIAWYSARKGSWYGLFVALAALGYLIWLKFLRDNDDAEDL